MGLYAQKMGLDGMASARGHRIQGTEHDIAFFLALGCAIALHCIALHCIALYCSVLYCTAFYNCRSDRGHNCMLRRWGWMAWRAPEDTVYDIGLFIGYRHDADPQK